MTESAEQFVYGSRAYCARVDGIDCPWAVAPEPVPVLGPFIGLVGSVLCGVAGALLLIAPFAFDYRQGASSVPHSSVVDLATGGGVLLLALLTAGLFGGALHKRLRAPEAPAFEEAAYAEEFEAVEPLEEPPIVPEPTRPEPEPQPVPAAAAALGGDPGGALRDLLTPLVAALAADLRARESAAPEGRQQ
jgi:hypothetical protein